MALRLALILLLGVPLGIATALAAARAWRAQRAAHAARRWPRTVGYIVSSEVRAVEVRQRVQTSTGRYRMARRYTPAVVYAYEVGGVRRQAERLGLGPRLLDSEPDRARRTVARYPIGSPVTVSYNPDDPTDATLDPRAGAGALVYWLVALLLLLILVATTVALLAS